jgi:hypothetical protein
MSGGITSQVMKQGACINKGKLHAVASIAFFDDDSVLQIRFECHKFAQLGVNVRREILEKVKGDGQPLERVDFVRRALVRL